MNTCKCSKCKGKDSHYSDYYHREEGFDSNHNNMVKFLQEEMLALRSELRKYQEADLAQRKGVYAYQDS